MYDSIKKIQPSSASSDGLPLELLGASRKPKILLIGLHGNELLAPNVMEYIINERKDLLAHVDYICGNPEATEKKKRYIEGDLNRCFGDTLKQNYEEKRAVYLTEMIRSKNYDYILDVHTSKTNVGRLIITANLEDKVKDIVASSTITRIVLMPPPIAKTSLIGQFKQSLSIEYNDVTASSPKAVDECIQMIDSLINDEARRVIQREVYRVTGTIDIDKKLEPDASNFTWSNALQGYPILYGNNTYKKTRLHQGFFAPKRENITI